MKQYYLHNGIAESGPYSLEELRLMAIMPTTKVRFENTEYWYPASQLEMLGLNTGQGNTQPEEIDKDWKGMSNSEKAFFIVVVLIGWSLIIGVLVYAYLNWSHINAYIGELGKKYAVIQFIYDPSRSTWSNVVRICVVLNVIRYLFFELGKKS